MGDACDVDDDNDGVNDELDCAPLDNTKWQSASAYIDIDGDGYDAGSETICYGASLPEGYSLTTNGTDCNDNDGTVHTPQTYYADNDGDGFGDANNSISECTSTAPSGYVTDNTDCDDTKLLYADSDGDGYGAGSPVACGVDNNSDCNDADGTVHAPQTYYADNDGDGFGDANNSINECTSTAPSGYVTDNTDCDDTQLLYADSDGDGYGSGSPVACGVDNNTDCNDADGTVHTPQTYYADNDGDGFGDANNSTIACSSTAPSGYVADNTDCDDTQLLYADNDGDGYGAGPQVACGVDNSTDCNDADGTVHTPQTYYADNDGDGFGDVNNSISECSSTPPSGYVTDNTDCDDSKLLYADNDGDSYGAGSSVACGVDNNTDCNDADGTVHTPQTYYADNDGDGFGDVNNSISECTSTPPSGYVTDNTDCDDSKLLYADNDGDGYGAGSSVACGVDNNTDCNDADITVHAPQTYYADNDGDGFGDANNSISVCASTAPSGYVTDNTDCDDTKLLYADNDGDGYGAGSPVACGVDNNTDCNDADGTVHSPQTYYADNDGDGFGDANNSISECSSTPPSGYVTDNTDCDDSKLLYADNDGDGYGAGSSVACGVDNNTDCNDADGTVHPGAAEICGNGIDDNCDGHIDEGCNTPVTISIADASIVEGNNGLKAMKFIVSLSKAATQKVTVNFRTQNGTALAGSDYALTLGSVSFKKGLTQKVIKIIISGDRQVEPDETFTVELSNPKNAAIADGTATGTILNDDFSSLTTSPEITTGDNKPVKPNYTVKIWPNPVRDLLTVQLVGVSNGEVSLQLQDIQGRVLKQGKVKPFTKLAQQQIDVSGFANGVYLLVIVSDTGGIQSKKIIVDHSH
nr:Calx-beta domain-containing protein [Panacibacter ginsenosidivorans]